MKRCVVITGTGRSGTSMTAGLLRRAGVAMSDDMIEPSAQNPLGSFEDRRIQNLQREMLSKLGPLSVPPPMNWLKHPEVSEMSTKLRDVVMEGVKEAGDVPWGFKDPHSAFTMPLWTRIFNEQKINPVVYLCVRDPSAVVTSLIRQYDFDPAVAEVFWLTKNLRAILDTGADLFFVHYEDLLSGDLALLNQIIEHAHIPNPAPVNEVKSFIDPKLDRSSTNSHKIKNDCVSRLWDALRNCRGTDFDRQALMQVANEIDQEMAAWSGWLQEVYRVYRHKHAVPEEETNALEQDLDRLQQEFDERLQEALSDQAEKHIQSLEALKEQSKESTQSIKMLEEQLQEQALAKETLEARILKFAEAEEVAHETIAAQLRQIEVAQEQTQNAAEEIARLQIFAQSLKREENKIRSEARKQIDAIQGECDRQKDEIIALHGSTTQRFGRQLRALRDAPFRESLRLPGKIRRILLVQRSKRREGLR